MLELDRIYAEDCLVTMTRMESGSIDAIVTDPPAGIGFMGKEWDHHRGGRESWIAWMEEIARECCRTLKPGAHALVWALPRTSHWTATAWENAGFEVRDRISHIFGHGFPKSMDISKAIDRRLGVERPVIGKVDRWGANASGGRGSQNGNGYEESLPGARRSDEITAPASDEAKMWDGWGTALKPACEDWWLLRKPVEKSIVDNILRNGTGGLNVDGCRISGPKLSGNWSGSNENCPQGNAFNGSPEREAFQGEQSALGRWPANVITDGSDPILLAMPEARMFYCAKASTDEREAGLRRSELRPRDEARKEGNPRGDNPRNRGVKQVANHHPTVKPLELMEWLVRLITPPKGVVYDPFAGSGTTCVACINQGFRFIASELNPDYASIAEQRIRAAQAQGRLEFD